MLLDGLLNATKSAPHLLKIIFEHKLNLRNYLKGTTYDEVYSYAYSKAKNEIENTFTLLRPFVYFFECSASDIAHKIAMPTAYSESRLMLRLIYQKTLLLFIFLSLNSFVFVAFVTPFLNLDITSLNYFEIIIHPYIFQ